MEINKAYGAKCYQQMMKLGIHPGQVPFLMLLSQRGEMSQKEVARELHVKPPTVNVMVQRMEKAGFVVTGRMKNADLVEIVEIKDHPFMIGVQFHPEFKSRPGNPEKIFLELVRAGIMM